MKISDEGVEFIKRWEGLSLVAYKDAAGFWTIGYGHLLRDWVPPIDAEMADAYLREDLKTAEKDVTLGVKVPINQRQFDALVSFTFNVGGGAFRDSTLLKWINEERSDAEIPKQFVRWINAGGNPILGLARRRVAEAGLFLS